MKRGLGEKYQDICSARWALRRRGLGLHSVVEGMNGSVYPVLFIASLAIGGVAGTAIDIEGRFDRLTEAPVEISEGGRKRRNKRVFRPASCCSASALSILRGRH